jgi:hypothetical protein
MGFFVLEVITLQYFLLFGTIKNFLKPTIPEASHRGISLVSF